jgi:hypothetical protein
MSTSDKNANSADSAMDDALAGFNAEKRATLVRLITSTAFAAPIVSSFAMDALTISKAHASPGNGSGKPI